MSAAKTAAKSFDISHIEPSLQGLAVPIADVYEDPSNVRKHPDRSIDAIVASLKRFRQQKPIVIAADGRVLAGCGTVQAARKLGWTHIAAQRSESLSGSHVEAAAFALADNRSAEHSFFDQQGLADMLDSLRQDGVPLEEIGWSDEEFDNLLSSLGGVDFEGLTDEDSIPEPLEQAVSQRGDLWILGDHRLLCGDSASHEDVDRLVEGQMVDLVNTDPPYNVRVEPRSNNAIASGLSSFSGAKHHQSFDVHRDSSKAKGTTRKMRPKDRALENDFMPDGDYDRVLRQWFGNLAAALKPGGSFYIWGGYANCGNYPPALAECELYFSQAVIWVKEHPVLTRKNFMGNHEWAFFGWRLGAAHWFNPEINNATDVWSVKKVNPNAMVHLTEKPVELAVRALTYSSKPGQTVLDLFGGSGSTLIAAEKLGRKARLIEIDPPYCDVILRRWEQFTGHEARLEDGRSFADISEERREAAVVETPA